MADEETNNSEEEEVATEVTLLEMVEQLHDANQLQKSMQESSLETTKVLTSIAKILQAQLDLDEQKKLKEGRQLDKPSDDDGGEFKFEKLEMPTSVAEGIGVALGFFAGSIQGFVKEVKGWFTKRTKEVKGFSSKTMKSLQNTWKLMKQDFFKLVDAIAKRVTKAFKFIFQPLVDLRAMFSPGGKVDKMLKGLKVFFGVWQPLFSAITRVVTRIIAFIVAPIVGIMKGIEEFEKRKPEGIGSQIVGGIIGFFTGVIDFMVVVWFDLLKDLASWIGKKFAGDENAFSKSLDSFSFTALFNEFGTMIADFLIGIPQYFKNAFKEGGGFTGMLGVLFKDYNELVTNLLGFSWELLGKAFTFVTDKLGITNFLKDFKIAFVKSLEDAWKALKNAFSTAFDYVMEKLGIDFDSQELVTIVSDWWDDLIKGLKEKLGFAWKGIKKLFNIDDDTPTAPASATADSTSPSGTASASTPQETKVALEVNGGRVTLPSGKISVGGNKGTVTNADGVTRDLTKEEIADVRMPIEARDSDKRLLAKKEMHQSTIDENAGDGSSMSRRKTSSAKAEIRKIDKEIELRASLSAQGSPEKIGNGTILPPAGIMQFNNIPTGIRASYKAPASALTAEGIGRKGATMVDDLYNTQVSPMIEIPSGGSAVNQGQALGVGTANLNDAKSRQQSAPPMMLSNSPNNSQTSNSNVSNNYTTSNVTAWDRYDPFANQMPTNAAK